VKLLLVYLVFMIAGAVLDYFIGLAVERIWGQTVSLIVFLALYFFFIWAGWVISVWITAPRPARSAST
jgi:hypothetical protein